jgi:hypothetical protein
MDPTVAALIAAKAKCSDACADEVVHAPHREALEAAYADFAASSKERASLSLFQPDEPVGYVTITRE